MGVIQTQSGPVLTREAARKAMVARMRGGCNGYGRSTDHKAALVRAVVAIHGGRRSGGQLASGPVAALRVRQ